MQQPPEADQVATAAEATTKRLRQGVGLVLLGLVVIAFVFVKRAGAFILLAGGLLPLIAGLALIASAALRPRGSKREPTPSSITIVTALDPVAARRAVVQQLGSQGASITHSDLQLVSGAVSSNQSPNWVVAVGLGLLCVVPAIYYIVTRSRSETTTFSAFLEPVDGGTRIELAGMGRRFSELRDALSTLAIGT